ncbi:Hypothetical protein A7982_08199 [Minicystis rosea]|nr:Hypothetical protein A7982_08199 [Minicystis rosea]
MLPTLGKQHWAHRSNRILDLPFPFLASHPAIGEPEGDAGKDEQHERLHDLQAYPEGPRVTRIEDER